MSNLLRVIAAVIGGRGNAKKMGNPTLAEGLSALEHCGIRRRDDVSLDDVLYSLAAL